MYYVNGPGHYYPHHYPHMPYWSDRPQYPTIDTSLLHQSANETKKLMNDANIIIDRLAESQQFSTEVMNAAQMSDHEKVKSLMHSTGIASDVETQFNPDGLRLIFKSQIDGKDCCKLRIALRWR
ncbi:hypothetical protein [Lentibacillus juripiscarius]|uniref:Uncharacterized protein n=1 Tax=Lentibacillus juripiscarius TaxID=257446 RepID=A0ABW5V9N9_9BACI